LRLQEGQDQWIKHLVTKAKTAPQTTVPFFYHDWTSPNQPG
jgi:hypothetical protein